MESNTSPSREHKLTKHGSRYKCERCETVYYNPAAARAFPCTTREDGTTGFIKAGEI